MAWNSFLSNRYDNIKITKQKMLNWTKNEVQMDMSKCPFEVIFSTTQLDILTLL